MDFSSRLCALRKTAALAAFASLWIASAAEAATAMLAPSQLVNQTIYGASGTLYPTDSTGCIASVAQGDVQGLLNDGFLIAGGCPTSNPLRLSDGKNANGSALVASSAASGGFLIAITLGTSEGLTGETAQGNTKTDTWLLEYVLPGTYRAGAALTFTGNAKYACTGTAGTKTIAAHAYLTAAAGTQGSDLVATTAQTLTTSDAAYGFAIPGTGLSPGSRLVLTLVTAMQETGGSSPCNSTIDGGTLG